MNKRNSKQARTKPTRAEGKPTPDYLTAYQVAIMTGFTPKALESKRARGEGPPFLRVGRRIRYRASDVRAWIEGYAS